MSFTSRPLLRLSRARAVPSRPAQTQRRTYASAPDPSKGGSNSTWIAIAAVLGIPAAYYMMSGSGSSAAPPSSKDQPATRKAPAGQGSMSSKQEGLDNADSSHPYINEPGKSITGEGETETAKFKGVVSPNRPQN